MTNPTPVLLNTIKFELTLGEFNLIVGYLQEGPYKHVCQLMQKLATTVKEQTDAAAAAEAAVEAQRKKIADESAGQPTPPPG